MKTSPLARDPARILAETNAGRITWRQSFWHGHIWWATMWMGAMLGLRGKTLMVNGKRREGDWSELERAARLTADRPNGGCS